MEPNVQPKKTAVTLNLAPEIERKLQVLADQIGQTLESYLERLAAHAAAGGSGPPAERSDDDWVAAFRAWAASHKSLPRVADDSRESIYAGQGE